MPGLATGPSPAQEIGSEAAAAPAGDGLLVQLDGFEGPLDLLLDLARKQQVDLARISALTLVDQYLATIERLGTAATGLARAADWLVMAAWLTWLKSRLLLPRASKAAKEAERAANVLIGRLAQMERVRTLAAWLQARPQLGRDTHARGAHADGAPAPASVIVAGDLGRLYRACLAGLRRKPAHSYALNRPLLWRVADAIARLRALLGILPDGSDLLHFVPGDRILLPAHHRPAELPLQRRGALAASLVGALELARDGCIDLSQDAPFGPVRVHARSYGEQPTEANRGG